MSGELDTNDGQEPLSRFLPQDLLTRQTLEQLSGVQALPRSEWATNLVAQVEHSWTIPVNQLSCEQVNLLVGQRFPLEWLAEPIALFVTTYPQANCGNYPGDLAVNALRALDDLMKYAPAATALMIKADYSWLKAELDQAEQEDEFSGKLYREAWQALMLTRE